MSKKTLSQRNRDHNRSIIFHFSKLHKHYSTVMEQRAYDAFKTFLGSTGIQDLKESEFEEQYSTFLRESFGAGASNEFNAYLTR